MKDYRSYVIYPPESRLKVDCRVYDTQRSMLAAIRRDDATGIANDTAAFCATDKIPAGHLAVIYFCKTYLTHENVAHEATHAGLALLARRKVKEVPCTITSNDDSEEMLAQIVGRLTGEFHRKHNVK